MRAFKEGESAASEVCVLAAGKMELLRNLRLFLLCVVPTLCKAVMWQWMQWSSSHCPRCTAQMGKPAALTQRDLGNTRKLFLQ